MLIWFYAPMKPPSNQTPSGDRRMARLLIRALKHAGHEVRVISKLRSYDGEGDAERQSAIQARSRRTLDRLLAPSSATEIRPDVWFTYHLYHKAPDWLGPEVSTALKIPYVIAEASRAPKRATGPWANNFQQCDIALARANAIVSLNKTDDECVAPALSPGTPIVELKPFLDPSPFVRAHRSRKRHRQKLATTFHLNLDQPWLATAAMMRPGDKMASYIMLAEAVTTIDAPLLIAGDGTQRSEIEGAFKNRSAPTIFLGALAAADLAALFAAADVFVWPAVNEAYGMALLEAQAAGCPTIAGRTGGVPGIVADGVSGLLVPPNNLDELQRAISRVLADHDLRHRLSDAALHMVQSRHTVRIASQTLDRALTDLRST